MFTVSPTRGTVAPGGSLSVTVTFRPVTAIQVFTEMAVVSDATSGVANAQSAGGNLSLLSGIGVP